MNPEHHREVTSGGVSSRQVGRPHVQIETIFVGSIGEIRFDGLDHFLCECFCIRILCLWTSRPVRVCLTRSLPLLERLWRLPASLPDGRRGERNAEEHGFIRRWPEVRACERPGINRYKQTGVGLRLCAPDGDTPEGDERNPKSRGRFHGIPHGIAECWARIDYQDTPGRLGRPNSGSRAGERLDTAQDARHLRSPKERSDWPPRPGAVRRRGPSPTRPRLRSRLCGARPGFDAAGGDDRRPPPARRQPLEETIGQIRTLPVSISYGLAPPALIGRNTPPAVSAASSAVALVTGVKVVEFAWAGLYMSRMIFHGPLNSPAVPFLPRPGAPVIT